MMCPQLVWKKNAVIELPFHRSASAACFHVGGTFQTAPVPAHPRHFLSIWVKVAFGLSLLKQLQELCEAPVRPSGAQRTGQVFVVLQVLP